MMLTSRGALSISLLVYALDPEKLLIFLHFNYFYAFLTVSFLADGLCEQQ